MVAEYLTIQALAEVRFTRGALEGKPVAMASAVFTSSAPPLMIRLMSLPGQQPPTCLTYRAGILGTIAEAAPAVLGPDVLALLGPLGGGELLLMP